LPRPHSSESEEIYSIPSSTQPATRCYQKTSRLAGKTYLLRTFRSAAGIEEVMDRIFTGFILGIPIAVTLAALGGSILTARLLSPLKAMGERARTISSASLSQRLPNPAPLSELGELATVFNGTLERLERSFESLRRFTADASHELRTPLTALRSVGEVALHRAGTRPDDFREAIASMLEKAARMETLIETLLMLARTEGGQIHLRSELIDLREFLEEIALTLAVLAQEKEQELTIAVQGKVQLRSDPALLRQALLNLIDNAIRYSPRNTCITLKARTVPGGAELVVGDQGPGIAPADHDRFVRLDESRSRQEGGTGLGLAIVKLIIGELNGTLQLQSQPGQGSQFLITLPATLPQGPEPPPTGRY